MLDELLVRNLGVIAEARGRGRLDLATNIVGHHVAPRLLEDPLVEGQRLLDLAGRDPPDGEADMVQDVVAGSDGLIDHVESRLAAPQFTVEIMLTAAVG